MQYFSSIFTVVCCLRKQSVAVLSPLQVARINIPEAVLHWAISIMVYAYNATQE